MGETRHQVYFRTSRGGCGIEWDVALTELRLVCRDLGLADEELGPPRMRFGFRPVAGTETDLVSLMPLLGYSQALVRAERLVGEGVGRSDTAKLRRGRWPVGPQRMGDDLVVYTELWSTDEAERVEASPHKRPFPMVYDGRVTETLGSRGERRLSPCDAKFLVNLSQARPGEALLDPYAGIGGIIDAAGGRGLRVLAGDIEEALRLGLHEVTGGMACIWDARRLPLADACADVVVAEPTYSVGRREQVVESLEEMARCLRPAGRLVMLMDPPLYAQVMPAAAPLGLRTEHDLAVRRQGFVARAVCWQNPD